MLTIFTQRRNMYKFLCIPFIACGLISEAYAQSNDPVTLEDIMRDVIEFRAECNRTDKCIVRSTEQPKPLEIRKAVVSASLNGVFYNGKTWSGEEQVLRLIHYDLKPNETIEAISVILPNNYDPKAHSENWLVAEQKVGLLLPKPNISISQNLDADQIFVEYQTSNGYQR